MNENTLEEDLQTVEQFLKNNNCKNCETMCTNCDIDYGEVQAITHILAEYRKILEENEELNVKILSNAGIYQLGLKDARKEIKDKIEIKLKKAEKYLQEAIRFEKEAEEKEEATLWWTAQIRLDERIKVLKEILKGVKKDGNGDNV